MEMLLYRCWKAYNALMTNTLSTDNGTVYDGGTKLTQIPTII